MKIVSAIRDSYRILKPSPFLFWIYCILQLFVSIMTLFATYCLSRIIVYFSNVNLGHIYCLVVILLITYFFLLFFQYLQFIIKQNIEKETRVQLKKDIIYTLFNCHSHNFIYNSAQINEIIYTDCNNITTIIFSCISIGIGILNVIFTGYLLFTIDVLLSLILSILLIIISLFAFFYSKKIKKVNVKLRQETDVHFKIIRDILKYIRQISISNSADFYIKRYNKNLDSVKEITLDRDRKTWLLYFCNNIFSNVWIILMLCFGIVNLYNYKFSYASFILFFSYSRLYSANVINLYTSYSSMLPVLVSAERVFKLLNYIKNDEEKRGEKNFPSSIKCIKIQNLSFSYGDKEIFINLNKDIIGNVILLVGKNGVGKTTLLNLLSGFYTVKSGNILINNESINDFRFNSIRNSVSYMPQDDIILDVTIKENILSFSGSDEISMEQVENVCNQIGILDDIYSLKDGFDTLVSEAREFSYGQKKKILLVRAFIKPSKMILLDEPLAGLDILSQERVVEYIKIISENKIVFISTHNATQFPYYTDMITL